MVTLVLQIVLAWTLLAFAVLGILAGRSIPASEPAQRRAWSLTGVIFAVYAVNMIVQTSWAPVAFAGGSDSGVSQAYGTASPVFNHSRTLLLFVFYGALAAVAIPAARKRISVLLGPATALALVVGGAYGFAEGRIQAARHFPSTAIIDTVGFIVLGAVLLLLLTRNAVDRWLWFALVLHGVLSLMGVIFLTAMAWADTEGSWTPPFWSLAALRVAFALGMAALAAMRLRDARRGVATPGLLEPMRVRPHVSIG